MKAWTHHGGRLADAKLHFDLPHAQWLDLSTGINPHAWPGAADIRIDWQALPETRHLEQLEQAAAACFNVDKAHVCAIPGTEIGLRLLGSLLRGPAVFATPSYRTHAEMLAHARPVAPTAIGNIANVDVILANPNNPAGSLTSAAALLAQLEQCRASSHWLIIDEAFADPNPETSMTAHVSDTQPLIIFRSFGKFFGLAGVRLGFVIAPPDIIAQYRDRLGSWPVSAAALAIGSAAYRDTEWIATTREALPVAADALDRVLRAKGYHPNGNCPLFRLIETPDAPALFDHLARRAILTRPFDYDPGWLRIGLPTDTEGLARLDEALADG